MRVRKAEKKDINKISDLLSQVDLVHYNGRPDIFKIGEKHSPSEIEKMLSDEEKPILVCADDSDEVLGYCFCIFTQYKNSAVLTDVKTLYIDDLCVDNNMRGQGIGKILLKSAENLAKETGCYNITLNVWTCNPTALEFYKACGYIPQKIVMEKMV